MYPEIADRKLCFGLFCDPSLTLRISSGLRLRIMVTEKESFLHFAQDSVWPSFFVILLFLSFWPWAKRRGRISSQSCHSEGALATEESPQETLRLRLRVTSKGVILSIFFFILSLLFLSFWGCVSNRRIPSFHQTVFSIREFLRFGSGQRLSVSEESPPFFL
jgi:hypothetical protein